MRLVPSQPSGKHARGRRARGSLSREEILAGAYEVVTQDGLTALSMPVLARHLGAGVTSIYWYFRNKEDLLVALAERVTEDVYSATPRMGSGRWDEELREYFLEFRRVLHRFPVYLELFSVRPRFVLTRQRIFPMALGRAEEEVTALVRAGLSTDSAARAYYACSVYTRGFALLEEGVRRETETADDTLQPSLVEAVDRLTPDAFPVLTAIGNVEVVTALDDERFISGLDLLLDGIRGEVADASRAKAAPRRTPRRAKSD